MPWRVRVPGRAFAPHVIVFIPHSADGSKPGQEDSEWLPRQCPVCRLVAVIGHGRRLRQAHDALTDWISVRRGICKACGSTLTVLPFWCVPGAPYSLLARQEALAQGTPIEQAAPCCRDPDHLPDASTIRRWFWRRIESLYLFAWAPTLFAWDWRAASRILMAEALSP